jgi:hypothetical protein
METIFVANKSSILIHMKIHINPYGIYIYRFWGSNQPEDPTSGIHGDGDPTSQSQATEMAMKFS